MTDTPRNAAAAAELQRHIDDQNFGALRISAIIGYTIVPGFWLLDVLVLPEQKWLFGAMRLFAAVCCIIVHLGIVHRPSLVRRYLGFLSQYLALLVAWSIEFMVFSLGGYDSPYYAGLLLVVMTIGYLFAWPLRTALLFNALVYVPYLAPTLFGARPWGDGQVAVANHVFLLSTMLISSIAQQVAYGLRSREILGRIHLEQTREELEGANARLQESDRLKSEFFNNITHELRTPLTMILSPLDVLLRDTGARLDESERASLQLMWRNAIKLLRLIETLLDLSRIEEKYLRLRVQRSDLVDLLEEIVQHTQPLAARKHIHVSLQASRTADDLWTDHEKLERVVVNLLSNALKFTDDGGRVTLWLDADETHATIAVEDNGIGIAPEAHEVIFERFRQADGGTTRRYGGTGIGLAFAREIARLHGGDIHVESEPGQGSTFILRIPRGRDHLSDDVLDRRKVNRAVPEPARANDREPREWSRALALRTDVRFVDIDEVTERRLIDRGDDRMKATRILVVEDNVELLRFIHTQLQGEHAVYLAQDGLQGLELAERERPDVIVTDYMMPELDGLGLIAALKQRPALADVPVVLLTAKADPSDRIRGREAGADIYLSKPFSPSELRAAIRTLLERRGRQASSLLAAQTQSLELISAGLAHELHNPLSYVRNAQHAIARDAQKVLAAAGELSHEARADLDKPLRRIGRMLDVADTGIERIEAIVELVRRYARDGYPEGTELVAFDDLVRDVLRFIVPPDPERTRVRQELSAPGALVEGRADELQQVVRNLIQNAVDAVTEHGEGSIRIRTGVEDGMLRFVVEDDGPGIPRERIGRVFTPFFSTKAGGDGMGLGLAICHQVVRAHDGLIEVESAAGEGARFEVRLPLAEPAP